MAEAAVRACEIAEVEETAAQLLPHRTGRIHDGRIDGVHWFVSLLREAQSINRRRRAWRLRKSA